MSKLLLSLAVAGSAMLAALPADAQFDDFWLASSPANWNSSSNWSDEVPDIAFQQFGVVTNGGTAFVSNTPPDVGGIALGRAAGASSSGTLEIRSGGNLSAVTDGGAFNHGAVTVGDGGAGVLDVQNGGQLSAVSLTSGGDSSSITISGNGQLTTIGSASLNALTNIVGQNASLNVGQGLSLGNNSRVQVDITGSSAPLIQVGGGAGLGGALEVDFGGAVPSSGTWNLLDAGGIGGQFSQVNLANGSLGPGQRLSVRTVPDQSSVNGVYGQLSIEQLLVLQINRDTGAATILNPSSSTGVGLNGYAITTGNNSFNSANGAWSSLSDQPGAPGWIKANASQTQLAELKTTTGLTTVNGGGQLSLGTPWDPQYTQLGQNREDVVFRYNTPDGDVFAPVVYTGTNVNDMTLFVDDQGNAQLRNASGFSQDIEGYSIRSESMSLDPGGWDSLQDNAEASDWLEANPSDGALSEFKTDGVEGLSSQLAFNLGQLFDPSGEQDLVFEYLAKDASQPTLGKVIYQDELPAIIEPGEGDLNNDGSVDGLDFLAFQRGFGTAYDAADLAAFQANYGSGSSATAAAGAVPEPANTALLLTALLTGVAARTRRTGMQARG